MIEMQAAVFRGAGHEIETVQLNGPEAGEVLVRVRHCGVCHSDLHVMNRLRAGNVTAPMILGHEAAGVVESVGEGVRTVEPGDHVVLAFHPNCGACFFCLRGEFQLCERADNPERSSRGPRPRHLDAGGVPVTQGVGIGGFAPYTVMPERGVIRIDRDIPLAQAALVGCSVTTGVGAAIYTAEVEAGSTVAVIGLGGVGLNVVQGARLAGARRIIAVDLLESKREQARTFGATDVVDGAAEDAVQQVQALAGGYLDYAFEAIGLPQTVQQAFAMIRPGGTAVVVGMVGGTVEIPGMDFLREKRLIGSLYGSATVQQHIPELLDLYSAGRLQLDELVSKHRPLAELDLAFADMEAGTVARTVIDF